MAFESTRYPTNAVLLALVATLSACAGHGQNWYVPVTAPPEDVYSCVLRELGEADFTIVDADGASGFVHAKRVERHVIRDSRTHEIYATVIPSSGPDGANLQITGNAYSVEETEAIVAACS